MNPEELYKNLQRIIELEKIVDRKLKSQGVNALGKDPNMMELNQLTNSMPYLFSYEDFRKYHDHMTKQLEDEKSKRAKAEAQQKQSKDHVLHTLERLCTPSVYSRLEFELNL